MWNDSHICTKIDIAKQTLYSQSSADVSSLPNALNLPKSNLWPRRNVPTTLKIRLQYIVFRYSDFLLNNTLYRLVFSYEAAGQV